MVHTPPVLQERSEPETAYDTDAIVVRPIRTSVPVVLFSNEREAIRDRVAQFLSERGYDVVPLSELRRIETAAAERRLVLEGDQTCRASLNPEDVRMRYFRSMRQASVEVLCADECVLQVQVTDPDDSDSYGLYHATVRRGWDPRAWARAADRLLDVETDVFGSIGGTVGASHPPPIMFAMPEHIGPWDAPPDPEKFFALESKANGCGHPNPSISLTWTVALSVSASGRIRRCEATTEHLFARTSEAECLCSAAETLRFDPGKSGRRVRVDAVDTGGVPNRLRALQQGTEPWVQRLEQAPATAKCRSEQPLPEPLEATAVLRLTPDGGITKIGLFGEFDNPRTMQWARCIVNEWSTVELPCAPPGIEQLQVKVFAPER